MQQNDLKGCKFWIWCELACLKLSSWQNFFVDIIMSGKERIKTLQHKYLHVLVFLRQGALACFHLSR